MKSGLALLLMLVTVCAQTVTAAFPRPLPNHARACRCCSCGGRMDCCAVPLTPAPVTARPVTASSVATAPDAIPARTAGSPVSWDLPDQMITAAATAIPVFPSSAAQPLHQRLCVFLI